MVQVLDRLRRLVALVIAVNRRVALLHIAQQHFVVGFAVKRHVAVHALRIGCDVVHLLRNKERFHLCQRSADLLLHTVHKFVVRKRTNTDRRVFYRSVVGAVLRQHLADLVLGQNVGILHHDIDHRLRHTVRIRKLLLRYIAASMCVNVLVLRVLNVGCIGDRVSRVAFLTRDPLRRDLFTIKFRNRVSAIDIFFDL